MKVENLNRARELVESIGHWEKIITNVERGSFSVYTAGTTLKLPSVHYSAIQALTIAGLNDMVGAARKELAGMGVELPVQA